MGMMPNAMPMMGMGMSPAMPQMNMPMMGNMGCLPASLLFEVFTFSLIWMGA